MAVSSVKIGKSKLDLYWPYIATFSYEKIFHQIPNIQKTEAETDFNEMLATRLFLCATTFVNQGYWNNMKYGTNGSICMRCAVSKLMWSLQTNIFNCFILDSACFDRCHTMNVNKKKCWMFRNVLSITTHALNCKLFTLTKTSEEGCLYLPKTQSTHPPRSKFASTYCHASPSPPLDTKSTTQHLFPTTKLTWRHFINKFSHKITFPWPKY